MVNQILGGYTMKYIDIVHRKFSSIEVEDFIGKGITTKDTQVTTGYLTRGVTPKQTTLPAGTPVTFTLKQYNRYPETGVYSELEISTVIGGYTYRTFHQLDLPLMEAAKAVGIKTWREARSK